jgi:hypothetical protein
VGTVSIGGGGLISPACQCQKQCEGPLTLTDADERQSPAVFDSVRSVVETHTAPPGAEFGMKAPGGAFNASPPGPIQRKGNPCLVLHARRGFFFARVLADGVESRCRFAPTSALSRSWPRLSSASRHVGPVTQCQDPVFCTRRYESAGSSLMSNSPSHRGRSNAVAPSGAEATSPCLPDTCSAAANSAGVR